ncbi:hypothetical protein Salat_1693800 [Sesamum alatum]|uniref:RNase H type-1 domain-containing protein n=1 Tax=Sesamum alatum TaxID=300844 RepID=A0AAE1Y7Q4_9LAMI|nr:hypothetical protein Salat_1693800 [Sesamum alatum]
MRSTYNLHRSLAIERESSSTGDRSCHGWTFVWDQQLPPGVKVFIWRACPDAIPTLTNLERWSNLPWTVVNTWSSNCEEWMRRILQNLDNEDGRWLIMLCWAMWGSRNKGLMEWMVETPMTIVHRANHSLLAFKEVNRIPDASVRSQRSTRWVPPPAVEAEHTEALAARLAAEMVSRSGWENVIIEGDCLNLICSLQKRMTDHGVLEPIILDIHDCMQDCSEVSFSFIRREGNVSPI